MNKRFYFICAILVLIFKCGYGDGLSSSEWTVLQGMFGSTPVNVGGIQSNPVIDFSPMIQASQQREQQEQYNSSIQRNNFSQGEISQSRYVYVGNIDNETKAFVDQLAVTPFKDGYIVWLYFMNVKTKNITKNLTVILTKEQYSCVETTDNKACNDLSNFKKYSTNSIIDYIVHYLNSM